MAHERKSLIEPGLLPVGNDVLSRIIANDREKRRREEADPVDVASPTPEADFRSTETYSHAPAANFPLPETASPANAAANGIEDTGAAKNERTNVTTLQRTNVTQSQDKVPPRRRGTPAPGVEAGTAAAVDAEARTDRLRKALGLAATDEVAVVTVRVSAKLNEYMDRYVDRLSRVSPKRRYRKQDAVAEAFAAFFADHPLPPAPTEEEL